ncbi:hypothetical protein H4R20_004227 [Coemansia guatemalensis]|uniref:rRNA methyltransferase 1, mitochondrial n=1 Tax=Coemansia guatemalensis TaxID=2761395 RepID=A0A9W8HRV8_9FUNG|nr:hypothetical protein H4R20_004227 [Coemansia guatemalensis]
MRTLARVVLGRTAISVPGIGAGPKYLVRCNSTDSQTAFPEARNNPGTSISIKEHLYGIAPVKAALMQGRRPLYGIYVQKGYHGDVERDRISDIIQCARQQDIPRLTVPKTTLDQLSRGSHHQGVVLKTGVVVAPKIHSLDPFADGRYSISLRNMSKTEHSSRNKYPLFICLDEVQDPVNIGSAIRSAMFFGADGVIFSKGSCQPTPVVSKISAGSMECMNIYKAALLDKMLDASRSKGWMVICATANSSSNTKCVSIYDVPKFDKPVLLVIGSEGNGISPKVEAVSDLNIHIPSGAELPGYIDSLNAGVAAGVIMSSLPHVRGQQ